MAEKVKFGTSDLHVSKLNFGGNVFGWTLDESQSFKILDQFVDLGFNFIDTADIYSKWVPGNSGGESETIIGNWLKNRGKRDDIVITTKLGGEMGEGKKGLSAQYIHEAVEASLRRLQTDYIDLYVSHYDDGNTPVSDTIEAFNELIKAGKIRYIGASNFEPSRIEESNAFAKENNLSGYISLQPLYNLYDREKFESEYLPLVTKEELAVTSYYALASGFLSGKYRSENDASKSPRGEGIVNKYLNDRGKKIIKSLDIVADEVAATPAEVAIAWQLHKPFITTPIVSATSEKQLNELANAAVFSLSDSQVKQLDEASAY